jgi:hypothetical protein
MRERGGKVLFFKTSPHVKVMRASSRAYANAGRYERTSAIIDHGAGQSYVVDFFTVAGGRTQDYVFHGPNGDFAAKIRRSKQSLYDLTNVCDLQSSAITFRLDRQCDFVAYLLKQRGERAYIGNGWGQRDSYNRDRGVTLPYIVRRTKGWGTKRFASVFAAHVPGESFIRSVQRTDTFGGGGVKLEVETRLGRDYIECSRTFRVTSKHRGRIAWEFEP